jgi:UDP-N-acetyl-D-mannosaminuronic acid dehydrogenase
MNKLKICIFGMGYIGFPTCLLMSQQDHKVIGYDPIKKKIEEINKGIMPFNEKGIDTLYNDVKKNFRAVHEPEPSDVFLIAVPSPITKEKKCDLSYVKNATHSIKNILKKGNLVILESTVRPKTTLEIVKPILEQSGLIAGQDFSLAYVSEKAVPGNTLSEMRENPRIFGVLDEKSLKILKEVYNFVNGDIHVTDCTTAETAKLLENTYRDINIAFANELINFGEQNQINIWETIKLANLHPRVNIHFPGPGVGGHCIPIDPWFLFEDCPGLKIPSLSRAINDSMPNKVFNTLKNMVEPGKKISLLGLAYKKNVDDFRESPTFTLIKLLEENGYEVAVSDPFVKHEIVKPFKEVIKNSSLVLIVTGHDTYQSLNHNDFSSMTTQKIFDLRNVLDKKSFMNSSCEIITFGDYK